MKDKNGKEETNAKIRKIKRKWMNYQEGKIGNEWESKKKKMVMKKRIRREKR